MTNKGPEKMEGDDDPYVTITHNDILQDEPVSQPLTGWVWLKSLVFGRINKSSHYWLKTEQFSEDPHRFSNRGVVSYDPKGIGQEQGRKEREEILQSAPSKAEVVTYKFPQKATFRDKSKGSLSSNPSSRGYKAGKKQNSVNPMYAHFQKELEKNLTESRALEELIKDQESLERAKRIVRLSKIRSRGGER